MKRKTWAEQQLRNPLVRKAFEEEVEREALLAFVAAWDSFAPMVRMLGGGNALEPAWEAVKAARRAPGMPPMKGKEDNQSEPRSDH